MRIVRAAQRSGLPSLVVPSVHRRLGRMLHRFPGYCQSSPSISNNSFTSTSEECFSNRAVPSQVS